MIIVLLFGLVSFGASVVLAVRAAGFRRAHVAGTLSDIRRYGFRVDAGAAVRGRTGPLLRRLDQLADKLGAIAARFGWLKEEELRMLLRSAGVYRLSSGKVLGYRILATAFLPLLWLWISSGAPPLRTLLGFVFLFVVGWWGPLIYLRRRSRMRLEEIDYQMPELIDLLVTTVEAGLGLSASLQMAARRLQGPLGDELRLTIGEQDMGLSTEAALENMLERAKTPAVRSLVRSILQGTTLGVSIGKIMRDLADEIRKARRQKAEERAQKAPTKLLFPLIFLIFPAMFVVLLGPAVISFMRALGGG